MPIQGNSCSAHFTVDNMVQDTAANSIQPVKMYSHVFIMYPCALNVI